MMVASTWPGISGVVKVAEAWVSCTRRSYHWLSGDPIPQGYAPFSQTEAYLRELWQQISALNQEGRAEPLLVVRGSLADPIGVGQTWADLARAWNFPVLLTLPRRAAVSQAVAFAAVLHQAQACCLGWVLLTEPGFGSGIAAGKGLGSRPDFSAPLDWDPPSSDRDDSGQEDLDELDSTLAAHLEAQLGIAVLGRMDLYGQVTWDTDSLAAMGYV
ncbi:MAG: hypothetical protein ACUVRV_05950 [Cyanobacteriota bacterium]